MKTIFMLLVLTTICFSQATQIISWDANNNVKYWEIYVEVKYINQNFVIQDNDNYSDKYKKLLVGTVDNTGQTGRITYKIKLPLNNKWVKVGVIANNGVRSKVGASKPTKLKKKVNA